MNIIPELQSAIGKFRAQVSKEEENLQVNYKLDPQITALKDDLIAMLNQAIQNNEYKF
jgi:hypothetical protein